MWLKMKINTTECTLKKVTQQWLIAFHSLHPPSAFCFNKRREDTSSPPCALRAAGHERDAVGSAREHKPHADRAKTNQKKELKKTREKEPKASPSAGAGTSPRGYGVPRKPRPILPARPGPSAGARAEPPPPLAPLAGGAARAEARAPPPALRPPRTRSSAPRAPLRSAPLPSLPCPAPPRPAPPRPPARRRSRGAFGNVLSRTSLGSSAREILSGCLEVLLAETSSNWERKGGTDGSKPQQWDGRDCQEDLRPCSAAARVRETCRLSSLFFVISWRGECPLSPLPPALPAPAFSMVKKNTIPDGWRSLTPVGQPIPGTRFIAFKVPLKGAINQRLTPTQKFTPKDLIAAMKALNVELGLIIDLTYTTRYYEVKDLPKSVQYKKLYTVGLEVPDNATILQFKKWVRKFLWENAGNEKLIGVHCTNGINRTGYLICRYLIDVEGWDPEAAIQAFGDARGHRMDGLVYLTDLRTQPMRSNLGMDVWDADEDIIPPPHAMEGSIERFPNEDFQGSGKRLRIYDDHSQNDLQGQIQLRDFDFINKGPGQRRRPFHDHQTQDELRASMQMRNWDYNRGPEQRQRAFTDHQFYDDYQEDTQMKDLEFSNKGHGQSLRPFHGHQFHDDLQAERQSRDVDFNRGREQRQRSFPNRPSPNDLQEDRQSKDFDFSSRGRGQRRKLFHDHQSRDEFQTQMQLKELDSVSRGPGQRLRSFHDYESHDDLQTQMQLGDFEFVKRGRGQRLRPFNDHQPRNDLKTEMQLKDYDNKGPGQRRRPFHDPQPFDGLQEQTQLKDFDYVNKGHGQRPRPFHDHPGHSDLPHEWCSNRSQSFSSHENVSEPHFSSSPSLHRDYGSDNDDFNRNYSNRPNCPEDSRRMHPSEEFNRGKNRFAPYSSRTMHPSSSIHQEDSSTDYERKPFQGETTRNMEQNKRLPVVTVDYNYGLPLDCGPEEEEERSHYDLPPRDRYNWN